MAYLNLRKLASKTMITCLCTISCMAVHVRAGDGTVAGVIGPDLVISSLAYDNIRNWGSEYPGIILCTDTNDLDCTAAFSIGTVSCNMGDETALWIASNNQHPVIRQSIYRLLGGRFEQIGTSWVKHGFLAVNDQSPCTPSCIDPGNAGNNLRPGCADPYSSSLNGNRTFLGPASEVNAFTGAFPYPPILQTGVGNIQNRVQVAHLDLDRTLNSGARFFGEGHYVTADDAQAGNGEDNAAYKELNVHITGEDMTGFGTNCITPYCVWDVGSTFIGDPAIRAWGNADPSVRMTDARVPGEGLYILGAKVTETTQGGRWKYEYALANLNSDRSGVSFTVPIPDGANVTNIGFHDINHHSGEPWDGTDWVAVESGQTLTWSTTSFDIDPNANALRWSTLYNFRFEVNAPPEDSSVILGLFKPGQPQTIAIHTTTPQLTILDCNENGIADDCDVACGGACDIATCGTFDDCNGNGVPDDPMCEPDCNDNSIPDSCDILDCQGELWCGDCNENTAPDICDIDCDNDGTPDDCELVSDTDGDGVDDCLDLCPFTTPPDACLPDQDVLCRFIDSGLCFPTTRNNCAIQGGEPVCGGTQADCPFLAVCPDSDCRDGCIVGDYDKDGDIDIADVGFMQMCFSGDVGSLEYVLPSTECLLRFDFDADSDVDLDDYFDLLGVLAGP